MNARRRGGPFAKDRRESKNGRLTTSTLWKVWREKGKVKRRRIPHRAQYSDGPISGRNTTGGCHVEGGTEISMNRGGGES